MGCYLDPGDGVTIRDMEAVMTEKLRGAELIITEGLNVDLGEECSSGRDKEITAAVATAGL